MKEMIPSGKSYLNVGCGDHYAEGWVNTDVWRNEKTKPDVVVEVGEPYPMSNNTFDAIYLGHVLEHISWPEVSPFLTDMHRIAKPGAPVLAVGPDVYKTIQRWAKNQEPWEMVASTMEHQDITALLEEKPPHWWDGAAHHWNCHEDRLEKVMQTSFSNVSIYSPLIERGLPGNRVNWYDDRTNIRWPVVGYWWWQCAVMGYVDK